MNKPSDGSQVFGGGVSPFLPLPLLPPSHASSLTSDTVLDFSGKGGQSSEACRFFRKHGIHLQLCHLFIYSSRLLFIDLFKVCAGVWDTEMTLFNV